MADGIQLGVQRVNPLLFFFQAFNLDIRVLVFVPLVFVPLVFVPLVFVPLVFVPRMSELFAAFSSDSLLFCILLTRHEISLTVNFHINLLIRD